MQLAACGGQYTRIRSRHHVKQLVQLAGFHAVSRDDKCGMRFMAQCATRNARTGADMTSVTVLFLNINPNAHPARFTKVFPTSECRLRRRFRDGETGARSGSSKIHRLSKILYFSCTLISHGQHLISYNIFNQSFFAFASEEWL